jgi:hypothetical protein
VNAALTVVSVARRTVHEPVPEHPAPEKPPKTEVDVDVPDSVTLEPWGKTAVHVEPHWMPPGIDVTFGGDPPVVWIRNVTVARQALATQSPLVQSEFTLHPPVTAQGEQLGPPQSMSVSLPFLMRSSQRGTAQTLLVHRPLTQSRSAAQPALLGQGAQLGPPQSTSVSPLFELPSKHEGA